MARTAAARKPPTGSAKHESVPDPEFAEAERLAGRGTADAELYRIPAKLIGKPGEGAGAVCGRAAAYLAVQMKLRYEPFGRGPKGWDWLGFARACAQAAADWDSGGHAAGLADLYDYHEGFTGVSVDQATRLVEAWDFDRVAGFIRPQAGDLLVMERGGRRGHLAVFLSRDAEQSMIAHAWPPLGLEEPGVLETERLGAVLARGATLAGIYRWSGDQ